MKRLLILALALALSACGAEQVTWESEIGGCLQTHNAGDCYGVAGFLIYSGCRIEAYDEFMGHLGVGQVQADAVLALLQAQDLCPPTRAPQTPVGS